MDTTNYWGDSPRKEGLMASTTASRKLSELGFPGFSEAEASRLLGLMAEFGLTAHEAVYGGQEARRKMWEARGW